MKMSEFQNAMTVLLEKFNGEDILIEELHVVSGEIQMSIISEKETKGDETYEIKKQRGNQRHN